MSVGLDLKMLLLEVVRNGIWMIKVWIARKGGYVLLLDPRRRRIWAYLRLEVASAMVPPLVLLARHNKHGRGFQVWIVGLGAGNLVVFLGRPGQQVGIVVRVKGKIFVVQRNAASVRDGTELC